MPSLAWAAAAVAAVVLIGTAGTEARWTDTATIPGATVQTATIAAPAISCPDLTVSWAPVPGATGYVVLVVGLLPVTLPATSTSYSLSVPGVVSVEAQFGSTWVSDASDQETCPHL